MVVGVSVVTGGWVCPSLQGEPLRMRGGRCQVGGRHGALPRWRDYTDQDSAAGKLNNDTWEIINYCTVNHVEIIYFKYIIHNYNNLRLKI